MYKIIITRHRAQPDSEYCGRGSVLGNPFPIDATHSRDRVCDMYHDYFYNRVHDNDVEFTNELLRLHKLGVRNGELKLGCFCVPLRCHVETIKNYLIEQYNLLECIASE